jgi:hypothetical protein
MIERLIALFIPASMPDLSIPSRSPLVWNKEVLTSLVRPSRNREA